MNYCSITAQIRKESVGQKACENLPCVGMKLFVKFEINAFGNMGVTPGHTHTYRWAGTLL